MSRKKIIKQIPVEGDDANVIRVEVYYNMGGWNYFSGKQEARGLWLSISPLQVSERSTIYQGWSGQKMFVKRMARFSAKVLREFQPEDFLVDRLVENVANNNNLKIVNHGS